MLSGVIRTPFPLDEDTVRRVEKQFSEKFQDEVRLTQQTVPSLLGGIQVKLLGRIFDGSLQGQLEDIKAHETGIERKQVDWHSIGEELKARLKTYEKRADVRSAGDVMMVGDGVVQLDGLYGCRIGELIEFESHGYGIVMSLEEDSVSGVLLGEDSDIHTGMRAYGTGQVLSVPVGDALIGRVVNPLGQPLDNKGAVYGTGYRPIESPAPSILDRQPVSTPLQTGLIAVDSMVPVGRGQRELIIGDRQTGKTSVAIDAILNQRGRGVLCFYVAIGQKASSVAQIIRTLEKAGAMEYTTVVCSTASDSATMQYIAPYCGCAMAEHFMREKRDVLVVYDDLSKHAVAYRGISLLLRRSPGREAYPGDVFYLHSRLLERAAHLSDALGGGSMTALPIVETQTGDISAYIPTNVISITDGQIFLDTELFRSGQRPAVNVGLSVSRVGGAAQNAAMRKVSGPLRLELAQYRELQIFAQFSSDMDLSTQELLRKGNLLTEMLRQENNAPIKTSVQVSILYALTQNLLPATLTEAQIQNFKREFPTILLKRHPDVDKTIIGKGAVDDLADSEIRQALNEWMLEHEMAAGL